MNEDIIVGINKVITDYFKNNPKVEWIPVKEIMPALIEAGVFNKDEKRGLPIRLVLRKLDAAKALDKIPFVHAERKGVDTYWYLVREGAKYVTKDNVLPVSRKQQSVQKRENSDEYYLVGLCNELLNEKASHQHTFHFLLGDLHRDGKSRTKLPLDAYYPKLNLVIEFFEKEDKSSEAAQTRTVSKVSRVEQRKKYTERKREVLKEKNIDLIEMDYDEFECDESNKLVRNKDADLKILKEILKNVLT